MFSPVSAADLASWRTDVANLLPGSAVIQTLISTPDGAGGVTRTYSNAGTVACRVDPLPKKDRIELLLLSPKMVIDYLLTLPYGTSVDIHQRVIFDGNTWEIRGLAKEHSWAVSVRAYISRVQ
jgi:hypothetical protein